MRIIKKEKRWKKKPRKDTAQIVNAELQINKEKDNGRSDAEYNQQRHHQVDNQHQVIQEEWQTQKKGVVINKLDLAMIGLLFINNNHK